MSKWDLSDIQRAIRRLEALNQEADGLTKTQHEVMASIGKQLEKALKNLWDEHNNRELTETQFYDQIDRLYRQALWLFNHPTETD
jgi:hypothetical protein